MEKSLDCVFKDSSQNGIYKTLGAMSAKLTVQSELTMVKEKIKKKSEESSQLKKARFFANFSR